MTLYECEREAEKLLFANTGKYDLVILFDVRFPIGKKVCEWLDPSMGIFRIVSPIESDGFIMVTQMYSMHNDLDSILTCSNLRVE